MVTPGEGVWWDEKPSGAGTGGPVRRAKRLARSFGARLAHAPSRRRIGHVGGIAIVTDGRSMYHTHAGTAMERMLAQVRPDLVVADHGFAGTAIAAGIETIAFADVNDPALMVAHRAGQFEHLVVMEDNSDPDDYWPCYQIVASMFQRGGSSVS